MMEDLNLLGVEKHVAQDWHMWKAVLDGEIRTLNENDIILNNFNIGKLWQHFIISDFFATRLELL